MNEEQKIAFLEQCGVEARGAVSNMMDIETYDEILNDFFENIDSELSKIENFKNIGDMPNYAILVHAMKSNARSFGFNKLGEIAYNHEMASKANDTSFVNEHYNELLTAVSEVKQIITKYKELG